MDVTCERCGTEYEFDETLVSDRGTTVKCTQCGHLFKVFRPGGAPDGVPEAVWRVRRSDGSIESLPTLRELQRRIVQGALSPDDEISASGQPWKPLGAIAELESFFATCAGAVPASNAPGPARADGTVPFAIDRPAETNAPQKKPPRDKKTLLGVGAMKSPDPLATAPTVRSGDETFMDPPFFPDAATLPRRAQSDPPGRISERPVPMKPASAPPPPRTSDRPRPLYIDEEESQPAAEEPTSPAQAVPVHESVRPAPLRLSETDTSPERPAPKSRRSLIVATILLALAGLAFFQRDRIASVVGAGEDEIAPFLERGDAALARDEIEAYQAAIFELTRATALDARDPRTLTSLSRAHGYWAQALLFEAEDYERRASTDLAAAGEARRARNEAARHIENARRFAEDGVRSDPSSPHAALALADALRLSGDLDAAEQHFDRAREATPGPAAGEIHRVAALLAAARSGGDISAAARDAFLAVEAAPELIRNRALLARALLAADDREGARRHLRREDRSHEMIAPVLEALEREEADEDTLEDSPEPEEEVPPPEPDRAASPSAMAAAPTESRPAAAHDARGSSGAPQGRDYSWYVRRGESLLDRGDVQGAKTHFEAALSVRPGASEALAGLGNVALRAGSPASAIGRFRQATQNGYVDAYIGLGDAYRRTGQTDEARRAYERYLERSPSGSQAAVAHRHLENLRPAAPSAPPPSSEAPPTEDPRREDDETPPPSSEPTPTPSPSESGSPSGPAAEDE